MCGIRAVFLLSLVLNVLVNGYQDYGNLDGELEVLLKRLQESLEDEERGYELEDMFQRGSMSGIEVDPEITAMFNDMKLWSTNTWMTFKIQNKKEIVLDEKSGPGPIENNKAQFDELKNKLTNEPRYILFDFHFTNKEGREIKKIAFIFWLNEGKAKIRDTMTYASSKDSIKKAFTGLSLEFQVNDIGDFEYDTFKAEAEKKA